LGEQVAAAIMPPERRARRSVHVIRAVAALALISASAHSAATLNPADAWWEKVTVTIAGDGKPSACTYETSRSPAAAKQCDVDGSAAGMEPGGSSAAKDEFTRLTFERRFQPGTMDPSDGAALQPGDTLLGRQVLALAIDAAGAVKGCKIVAASGDMTPSYSCKDAAAEHFEASAKRTGTPARQGYMTILVYGHSEHVV
jgi:hypothetical protein